MERIDALRAETAPACQRDLVSTHSKLIAPRDQRAACANQQSFHQRRVAGVHGGVERVQRVGVSARGH